MFQSSLLKGALCALTLLEITTKAATSLEDSAKFVDFAAVMAIEGINYEWKSHPVTTDTGYQIMMFRITADPTGAPLVPTKGPVLLLHGMFSDPTDFFSRTDETTAALPIQLAMDGYDVWIGCSRGRPNTLEHTTLDKTDSEGKKNYWNFSFEEIGKEDITSMVDNIIAARN